MGNIFFIADTHFDHKNILTFKDEHGNLLRPFTSVEEMNHILIDNWNKVVTDQDIVYHLGDVNFGKNLWMFKALKGSKRLVRGNHDKHKTKEYAQYFTKILGSQFFKGVMLTHIPVHPASIARNAINIHGHLHSRRVRLEDGSIDPRYYCVSVENINYTPISIENLRVVTGRPDLMDDVR